MIDLDSFMPAKVAPSVYWLNEGQRIDAIEAAIKEHNEKGGQCYET